MGTPETSWRLDPGDAEPAGRDRSSPVAGARVLTQTEAEIKEMRSVLEHAFFGIARLNPQGLYLRVNQAYASMQGYEPDDMIGLDAPLFDHDLGFL